MRTEDLNSVARRGFALKLLLVSCILMATEYQEFEDYELSSLLQQSNRDLMMDIQGSIYETFEASPEHIYRTVKKLDGSYEGPFTSPWEVEYSSEPDHVWASFEKDYTGGELGAGHEVSLDPSYRVMVSPVEHDLEVEISGVMDIHPDNFLAMID